MRDRHVYWPLYDQGLGNKHCVKLYILNIYWLMSLVSSGVGNDMTVALFAF